MIRFTSQAILRARYARSGSFSWMETCVAPASGIIPIEIGLPPARRRNATASRTTAHSKKAQRALIGSSFRLREKKLGETSDRSLWRYSQVKPRRIIGEKPE